MQERAKNLFLEKPKWCHLMFVLVFLLVSGIFFHIYVKTKRKCNSSALSNDALECKFIGMLLFLLFVVPTFSWSEFMCVCVSACKVAHLLINIISRESLCLLVHLILKPVCRCHSISIPMNRIFSFYLTTLPTSVSLSVCVSQSKKIQTQPLHSIYKNCHDNNSRTISMKWNKNMEISMTKHASNGSITR